MPHWIYISFEWILLRNDVSGTMFSIVRSDQGVTDLEKSQISVLNSLENCLLAQVAHPGQAVAEESVHRLDLPAEPHLGVERGHGQAVARADTGLVLSAIKIKRSLLLSAQ